MPMPNRLCHAQVTVLDGNSKPVQQGKIGEVCLRGPNVTKGYLNRPEANEEVPLLGSGMLHDGTGVSVTQRWTGIGR